MGTFSVSLTRNRTAAPVAQSIADSTATTITTSGSSQQASITGALSQVWRIAVTSNVWVAFGTNPTAAAGSGYLLLAGTHEFAVTAASEKVAVIDA